MTAMMFLVFSALSLASVASVIVRRPWTIRLAKRHTAPAVWSTDLFLETNVVLTLGWALVFALGAALAVLAPLWMQLAYGVVQLALGLLSPRLGNWYSSRRLRAMAG